MSLAELTSLACLPLSWLHDANPLMLHYTNFPWAVGLEFSAAVPSHQADSESGTAVAKGGCSLCHINLLVNWCWTLYQQWREYNCLRERIGRKEERRWSLLHHLSPNICPPAAVRQPSRLSLPVCATNILLLLLSPQLTPANSIVIIPVSSHHLTGGLYKYIFLRWQENNRKLKSENIFPQNEMGPNSVHVWFCTADQTHFDVDWRGGRELCGNLNNYTPCSPRVINYIHGKGFLILEPPIDNGWWGERQDTERQNTRRPSSNLSWQI